MTNKPRFALDSSVIVDLIQGDEADDLSWWKNLEPVYQDAQRGKVELLVSEISIAEVCRIRSRKDKKPVTEEDHKKLRLFFENLFVLRRPAGMLESELAAEFIRSQNLETCDAIIAATAALHGAVTLYSRDGLKKLRESQKGLLKCDGLLSAPGKTKLPIKPPSAADYLNLPMWKVVEAAEKQVQ